MREKKHRPYHPRHSQNAFLLRLAWNAIVTALVVSTVLLARWAGWL